ncbi:MAG: hypothetical protein AAGE52_09495 [Myxococcota bacterium]
MDHLRMNLRQAIGICALAFGVASPAAAQDLQATAVARSLFHEGVELADAEAWSDAADRFRRAQELRPAPITAYNLSLALTQLGSLIEATEMLEWVLHHDETQDALRAEADASLTALRPRLAELRVDASSPATLLLDEREMASAMIGAWMPVNPGTHRLRAVRDETTLVEEELTLSEGERREVQLEVPPEPVQAARQTLPETLAAQENETQEVANDTRAAEERVEADLRQDQRRDQRRRRVRRGAGISAALAAVIVAVVVGIAASGNDARQGSLGEVDWR